MKLLIDALGAPADSGGMRLYAEEMLRTWTEEHPEDELVVLGYSWVTALDLPGVRVVEQSEGAPRRILGQWLRAGVLARRERVDALVSLSQVVSPLFPRERRVCTVHDWRHRLRPEEFSLASRIYRRGWSWSIAHAGHVTQISAKTLAETRRFVPGAVTVLMPLGRDQARRWPPVSPQQTPRSAPYALTFGHYLNKRPELVVEALASPVLPEDLELVVVGARGEHAANLARLAAERGVGERVTLPGFVPTPEYQALVRGAAVIVLASSDEGFGLPVTEADYFGVPCVVTDDGGLAQIHGERVLVAAPEPEALARVLAAAVSTERSAVGHGAEDGSRWRDTVERLREILVAD